MAGMLPLSMGNEDGQTEWMNTVNQDMLWCGFNPKQNNWDALMSAAELLW